MTKLPFSTHDKLIPFSSTADYSSSSPSLQPRAGHSSSTSSPVCGGCQGGSMPPPRLRSRPHPEYPGRPRPRAPTAAAAAAAPKLLPQRLPPFHHRAGPLSPLSLSPRR
ncbi:hypothetical protein DAI22_07g117350 [Oryza sativa Japonica Group]|nr:hypothetical protein DAI22_07g117350 [Oryza sativa Japonica Group]